MCGRFTLTNPEQITLRFDAAMDAEDIHADYNIAPTQQVAVVVGGIAPTD